MIQKCIERAPFGLGLRLKPLLSGDGLRSKAIRGSGWTLAGYGASQVMRLGSNLVLTRLLYPEAFGLMALVNAVLIGLQLFSDLGLGPSIVRSDRGADRAFLNTAWTINILRGVVVWLLACLLAFPASLIYGEPIIFHLIPVAALSLLITSFSSTKRSTAHRNLEMARLTIFELVSQAVAVCLTIAAAWALRSIWALPIGAVLGSVVGATLSHWILPGAANRIAWDWAAAKEIYDFGKWIFFGTAVTFLATQSDKLILGGFVPPAILGFYAIAQAIVAIPVVLTETLTRRILMPVASHELRANKLEGVQKLYSSHRILSRLAAPVAALAITCSSGMIALLYDDRYTAAGPIATVLAAGVWFQILSASYGSILMGGGDSKATFIANVCRFLFLTATAIPALLLFGHLGFALAISASSVIAYVVLSTRTRCMGVKSGSSDALSTAMVALPVVVSFGGASLLALETHSLSFVGLSSCVCLLAGAAGIGWEARRITGLMRHDKRGTLGEVD